MTEENLHKVFEHVMSNDNYIGATHLIKIEGQYSRRDIRDMFRGFKLGWNAARYLAEIEVGLKDADDGKLKSSEQVKMKWKNLQP